MRFRRRPAPRPAPRPAMLRYHDYWGQYYALWWLTAATTDELLASVERFALSAGEPADAREADLRRQLRHEMRWLAYGDDVVVDDTVHRFTPNGWETVHNTSKEQAHEGNHHTQQP